MATTSSERGLSLRSPGRFMATADRLVTLWHEQGRDPGLRDRVTELWMKAQAYRVYTFRTATRMMRGESIGADSSYFKLFWSEMDVALHEVALDLLGGRAELSWEATDAEPGWMKDYLFSLAGPIYAGTNEIQRNIVAGRVLELPRK
jgi:alkylation response protein AidB-like acyl-CoA dehydrogenase